MTEGRPMGAAVEREGRAIRVVAVSDDPALSMGLTFLGEDWEISSASSLAPSLEADVLVVDLGTTRDGVEALGPQPGRAPAVIIGTDPWELAVGDRFQPRPYTLDALAASIAAVLDADPARVAARTDAEAGHAGFWIIAAAAIDTSVAVQRRDGGADEHVIDVSGYERSVEAAPGRSKPQAASGAPTSGRARRTLRSFATRTRESEVVAPELRYQDAFQQFARGVAVGNEIERLLMQMPILGSLSALVEALVEDGHRELGADTTAFWQRFDDGFRVLTSVGLTPNERRLVAALDHPMLAEIEAGGGGLLIDPVEAAQAAVAGLGGAHTESYMAASIAIGPGRYGILAIGRNQPLVPTDLDALIQLATEAAPGLSIAQLLQRLDAHIVPPDVNRRTDVFADERTQKQVKFLRP